MLSFVAIDSAVLEKKDSCRISNIHGYGGHHGHVTWIIYKHIDAKLFHQRSLNITVIYMYIAPEWGQTTLGVQYFFYKLRPMLTLP